MAPLSLLVNVAAPSGSGCARRGKLEDALAAYRASQAIWKAMEERGDLYLGRYEGWYSVRDEAYYDDDELTEGENGEKLSPQVTPVEWTVEESWFFRLSKYQQPLLDQLERLLVGSRGPD